MAIMHNIVRSAMRTKKDTLKCLAFCRENEKYLKLFSKCNCELYILPKPNQSDWKDSVVADVPNNIFICQGDKGIFTSQPFFDCVIANDRLQEFDMALKISQSLHIPLITVDHVSSQVAQKLPAGSSVNVTSPLEVRGGNINVCLSENIKKSWHSNANTKWHGISITIPPYVNIDNSFDGKKTKKGIVIDNNVAQPLMNILGNTLSRFAIAPRFPETSFDKIREAKVYINTWNNIDIKTLEAMAMGCITISHRTPDTELLIKDKQNGLLFSDISELPDILTKCEEGIYDQIPNNAIETVKEISIDEESFIKKWNQVLSYISETFFLEN